MLTRRRAAAILAAAVVWGSWVLAHYYAWPLSRPEIADGVRGGEFPFWRDAAQAALRALAGAALTLGAAWGFGRLVLRGVGRIGAPPGAGDPFEHPIERLLFALAAGCAVLSTACVALAFFGAYRPPFLHALAGTGVALASVDALRGIRTRTVSTRRRPGRPSPGVLLPLLCVVAAVSSAFVGALAPEIEYDALWYHLWLPQQWLAAGAPVDLVHEYISLYPLFWQLLYGVAMTLGGDGAAKLLHFACLPLVACTAWLLARRLFPRANAWLAAALACASPLMIWEGTTAYNDLALAWFLALSTHALVRHRTTGDSRWLVLAGVTLGSALATKHLALLAVAAIALSWLARVAVARSERRGELRRAAALLAIAFAIPAPWYARAYVQSGNPFFPDLYAVFGARPPERWSPGAEASLARFKARFGPQRTARAMLMLPWDMTVHGARYGGALGPIFLVLVPFAWAGGRPSGAATGVAAGAAVYLAIWASPIGSFQMRFVVPLVPLFAVFAAAGAFTIGSALTPFLRPGHGVVTLALSGLMLLNLPAFTRWHERDRRGSDGWLTHVVRNLPARVVLGAMSRTQYLSEQVFSYVAWSYIAQALPRDARILTFTGGDHLYSTRSRLWSDSVVAQAVTWGRPRGEEVQAAEEAERLGITHVLFDKRQIVAGQLADLAISTGTMKACCLRLIYEDRHHQLYELLSSGTQ